jgi:hypothetical protein
VGAPAQTAGLAWTVSDSQRLSELVRLGVDGITTTNLAISGFR